MTSFLIKQERNFIITPQAIYIFHNKKLKKTLADEAIGDLKVTEFLIEVCEENKYINSKNSYKLKNDLTEIMKCLVGWRKSL